MDSGIGAHLVRVEDLRLLTGQGTYSDDFNEAGQAYGYVLRTPHAHALIKGIDISAAEKAPGVLAVLTAQDYFGDGLNLLKNVAMSIDAVHIDRPAFKNIHDRPAFDQPQWALAEKKVHHIGEPVAFVVAETVAQAKDAAELIEVDYEPLPAVTRQTEALKPGAPVVWDEAGGNLAFEDYKGDCAATDAAFAKAAHVVEAEFVSNRIANCQMEPRAALGVYDPQSGRYTLFAGSQGVHRVKGVIADALNITPDRLRVVSKDVGGGFGPRSVAYPEFALVAWASKRLGGRPVKWTCERSEAFLSDGQARDLLTKAALAFDADGHILAMKSELHGNVGGNTVSYVPLVNGSRIAPTLYRVPAICVRILAIMTNTLPSIHYRGAGRPQAMLTMERLLDLAADRIGIDRVEIRRRNLIRQTDFPYENPTGLTYDCGEFHENLDIALKMSDWDGFPARRKGSEARGLLRGIGVANYIETPVGAPMERAEIEVCPDGTVEFIIGTQSSGQGHETSFRQVVSDWLGVPFDSINMITGDSDVVANGGGTHSDRSIRMGGKVMVGASEKIIDKGKKIAGHLLEAADADIEFAAGTFTVAGTDKSIGIFDVAKAANENASLPEELRGALRANDQFVGRLPAYPNGCAVCEVEVDPDTGVVAIVRYSAVDDVGRVVNPIIVDGQTHGGIAQGVGQALMEHCVYGDGDGQILAGSFMDYALPRADNLPSFALETNEVPSAGNPLGVKGGGEAGTTGSLAAIMNAVIDALKEPYGITEMQMPASPHRVWQAIQEAKAKRH